MWLCAVVLLSAPVAHTAQNLYDIGSGGFATITGSVGGFVNGNSSVLQDLVVTVNLGDLSPINTNRIVKVSVPVAIRSTAAYQVTVAASYATPADPDALQLSDIGVGVQNVRVLGDGSGATTCGANSVINPQFNYDPSAIGSVAPNPANGRARFTRGTLANIGTTPTVIINGPQLSSVTNPGLFKKGPNNGYLFDLILAVAPQYYTAAAATGTITLNIQILQGPNFACA